MQRQTRPLADRSERPCPWGHTIAGQCRRLYAPRQSWPGWRPNPRATWGDAPQATVAWGTAGKPVAWILRACALILPFFVKLSHAVDGQRNPIAAFPPSFTAHSASRAEISVAGDSMGRNRCWRITAAKSPGVSRSSRIVLVIRSGCGAES